MKKSELLQLHQQIRDSFKFDNLKMYFGDDYVAKNGIVIRQPKIGEILEFGEKPFYQNLNIFVCNPTQYRLPLWKENIDWCKTSDFELFVMLFGGIDPEASKFIFPDIDFSSFKIGALNPEVSEESDEQPEPVTVLYSEENQLFIMENDYLEISQYLRTLFGIFPKVEKAKGRATKEALIWEDEEKANKPDTGSDSTLFPMISACVNHPGFKYKLQELRDVGIYEFMDTVNRLQIYENTRAMLQGSLSGFADMSKVPKDQFNFMRDMYVDNKPKFTEQEKEKFKQIQTMG